jgi:hypothetical protein
VERRSLDYVLGHEGTKDTKDTKGETESEQSRKVTGPIV